MSHDNADLSLPTAGLQSPRPFCLILWFLHTCLHLKEGKREAITPVLPEPEEQAQFCRRKLGRHIFSQLPFPICRSSSAPSLCPQPALDIQSRARHCCHLVHGPDSGINICSPVQFHTSFHASLLHLFRVLSSSGLDLSNAGVQLCTVVFTPWPGTQNCVTMHLSCGHARPFWESELIWVAVLLKLLFQQSICQREFVMKKFFVILALFSLSYCFGETLLYLFSASKILCQQYSQLWDQ